jgi:predicted ester cyclase
MPQNLATAKMAHGMAMKAFPDRKTTILGLIGEGDRVAMRARVQGTNTGGAVWFGVPEGNDKKIDFESWSIYRFKDGKVVESWGINDGILAMVQLGSLKPPM